MSIEKIPVKGIFSFIVLAGIVFLLTFTTPFFLGYYSFCFNDYERFFCYFSWN